jgi:tetratricopeptide (TPR) repeat protein
VFEDGTMTLPPLIGRDRLIAQVLDRLQRPDDVRERPQDFIQPGFVGMSGTGKTRLLQGIADQARTITPYVVSIDFDTRRTLHPPGTPRALLSQIINQLETLDQQSLKSSRWPWGRRKWITPFQECHTLLRQAPALNMQTITASGGAAVTGVTMAMTSEPLPPGMDVVFREALGRLQHTVPVIKHYGAYPGAPKPAPRPLVVIIMDTLELASQPVRQWLSTTFASWWELDRTVHVLLVTGGQHQIAGLITTPLAPLTAADAALLIREYVERFAPDPTLTPRQRALIQATDAQRQVIQQGRGIPLLLQILTEMAIHDPSTSSGVPGQEPLAQHSATVMRTYIAHVRGQAAITDDTSQQQRSYLLQCAALPLRIPHGNLLRVLLQTWSAERGIPAPGSDDMLWQQLRQEAICTLTGGDPPTLVLHELVRAGFLAAWQDEDPRLRDQLHAAAAAWFRARGSEVEALAHDLQCDPRRAFVAWQAAIESAIAAGGWPRVQQLLDAAAGQALTPQEQAWVTVYKADLAWGEGNAALALARFQDLDLAILDAPLRGALEQRLDQHYGATLPDADHPLDLAALPPHMLILVGQVHQRRDVVAWAYRLLGQTAYRQGQYPAAEQYNHQALALYEALGDRRGQATALDGLGDVARMQDQYPAAEQCYRQALALAEELGERRGQATALDGLGEVACMQDQYPAAEQWYHQALALAKELGNRLGQASVLYRLGEAARLQEQYPAAEQCYRQALALYEELGQRRGQANALDSLGDVARRQEQYPAAEQCYQDSLRQYTAIAQYRTVVNQGMVNGLSLLKAAHQHRAAQAHDLAEQAFALATWLVSEAKYALGQMSASDDHRTLHMQLMALEQQLGAYPLGTIPIQEE